MSSMWTYDEISCKTLHLYSVLLYPQARYYGLNVDHVRKNRETV